VAGTNAKHDELALDVTIDETGAFGWNASLTAFLEQWPDALPIIATGTRQPARAAGRVATRRESVRLLP